MTQLRPTLFLQRLVVLKSFHALYDQTFHLGLNIIRGENSSGKSTLADFIFFSLGGDLQDWIPEASAADSVHAEVRINGTVYTLSRDVEPDSHPPMYIFEGAFDKAMDSREKWLRYPYSRTSNTESFSQVVFNLLGLPEQKTEAQQNITLHQILRLLYLDQITPVDEIFRNERFDSRDTRTAVGELLLGIDDLELHDVRLRLRDAERQYAEVAGELRSMFQILGQTGHADISVVNYQKELVEAQTEQENLRRTVDELAHQRTEAISFELDEKTKQIFDALQTTKKTMTEQRRKEQSVAFDLEDSTKFVHTLEERLSALSASEHMASILGSVEFKLCPACFRITDTTLEDTVCHLCKSPMSDSEPHTGHLKMREELTFQLRESRRLIEKRNVELASIRASLRGLIQRKRSLEGQLSAFVRSVHAVDAEIELHMQRIGYLDRLGEDLNTRAKLAQIIGKRVALRDELSQTISSLKTELADRALLREKRIQEIKFSVSELCVDIILHDLPQEETFRTAELVEFDFSANKMWANERRRFSASSMTVLKNAFIFSLLLLSCKDSQVRWPRFLLLDNIEDKGMQPERSANFQELVEQRLADVNVGHQVILTTSMISPRLEGSAYCVGPPYTHITKTLGYSRR